VQATYYRVGDGEVIYDRYESKRISIIKKKKFEFTQAREKLTKWLFNTLDLAITPTEIDLTTPDVQIPSELAFLFEPEFTKALERFWYAHHISSEYEVITTGNKGYSFHGKELPFIAPRIVTKSVEVKDFSETSRSKPRIQRYRKVYQHFFQGIKNTGYAVDIALSDPSDHPDYAKDHPYTVYFKTYGKSGRVKKFRTVDELRVFLDTTLNTLP
jgi:hypothetical protein